MNYNMEEALFAQVSKLIHERQIDTAQTLIEHLPPKFHFNFSIRIKIGEIFYHEFYYEEALSYFTNLNENCGIEDSKQLARIRFNLARINLVLDYEILAEGYIKQAIELDPENIRYFEFWIKMLSVHKRFSDILALLPDFQATFMESGISLNYLAEALIAEGKYVQAEAILPFVLKSFPNLKIALIHYASIAEHAYDWDLAEKFLKAAITSKNYFDEYEIFLAWERLIQFYEKLQRDDEQESAQNEFDRIVEEFRQSHPNADI